MASEYVITSFEDAKAAKVPIDFWFSSIVTSTDPSPPPCVKRGQVSAVPSPIVNVVPIAGWGVGTRSLCP